MSSRKITFFFSLSCFTALSLFFFQWLPLSEPPQSQGNRTIDDASTMNRTEIETIIPISSEKDLVKALLLARERDLKVSIAGKKHTMGGHTFYKGAVVLDMTKFRQIKGVSPNTNTVVVESGATWNDIQEFLNPVGYSVIAMQGPNIFTVGGSISVNAHGWDKKTPAVADTVEWFRILLSDGTIRRCSRSENTELYHLALGGYGLFGVILDVGLRIAPNNTLKPQYIRLSAEAV